MIALLVGTSTVAGVVIAWYAYKASLRIAIWGENMNSLDQIVRTVSSHEEAWQPRPTRIWVDSVSDPRLMHPHLPMGHASK